MEVNFMSQAWEDYLYWQATDKKILKEINELIRQCQRTPYEGHGKPEALKGSLSGWYSRRINHKDRLIYRIDENTLYVLQCGYHYG